MNVAQTRKDHPRYAPSHVQADDGLKLPGKFIEVFRLAEVDEANLPRWGRC